MKGKIDPQNTILYKVQKAVMDSFKPLLFLYGQEFADSKHKAAVEASLRLLTNAVGVGTRERRLNIMNQTNPSFKNMLSDKDNFAEKEVPDLFGRSFVKHMVKAAKDEATLLASSRQQAPQFHQQPQAGTSRGGRGGFQNRGGGRGGFSNRGGAGGFHGHNNNGRYETVLFFPIVPAEPLDSVGGRLKHFAKAWANFCIDPWVLDVVYNGFSIDFVSIPVQHVRPVNMEFNAEQWKVCNDEMLGLLEKGATEQIPESLVRFISVVFTVPKNDGGFRPILNLKKVNQHIVYNHFKMENLSFAKHLIQEGDYFVKIDLKDAYLTVPLHPGCSSFLQFEWEGKFYQYLTLAFGLASAPWAFTKMLKPIVSYLRERGIRLVIYLDDILIMNASRADLLKDLVLVRSVLEHLGFVINEKKSVVSPSQCMEFLGMSLNSIIMSMSLPPKKIDSITSGCYRLLRLPGVRLREIASLLGQFAWAMPAVPFAASHYRELQHLYIRHSAIHDGNLAVKVSLSEGARADLYWWATQLSHHNGNSLVEVSPSLIICSDASLSGWGAVCGGVTANGPWSLSESKKHINVLELVAAFHALRCFADGAFSQSIRLFMDNSTAVYYVNKSGGSRSLELNRVAVAICRFCEERQISIKAIHLPGKLNIIADQESRRSQDWSDWMLAPSAFNSLSEIWSVEVDLFAASWNAQLRKFVGWSPQPGAMATDAFSISWSEFQGYAFPPFTQVKDCLSKIRREQASLVLICPLWPSQPWFPLLLGMACEPPRIFHPRADLLASCQGEAHPLSQRPSFRLVAWKLSGVSSQCKAFRMRWSTYSWAGFVRPHALHTSPAGTLGSIGAVGSIEIPCLGL